MQQAGGPGGHVPPPHFLKDQLTLSQPGGAHYPHPVLCAPRIFDPCCMPGTNNLRFTFCWMVYFSYFTFYLTQVKLRSEFQQLLHVYVEKLLILSNFIKNKCKLLFF